jgi:hypothetical protein
MKQFIFAAALAGLLTACSQNSDNPATAAADQKSHFGSATDFASKDGSQRNTNALDAADNGIGGPVQRESGNYESQPKAGNEEVADRELAKKIKVALTTGSTGTTGVIAKDQLTRIDVQVSDGIVTLSGPVANENEKKTVGEQVSAMNGVRSVVNNLTPGGRSLEGKPLKALVPRSGAK